MVTVQQILPAVPVEIQGEELIGVGAIRRRQHDAGIRDIGKIRRRRVGTASPDPAVGRSSGSARILHGAEGDDVQQFPGRKGSSAVKWPGYRRRHKSPVRNPVSPYPERSGSKRGAIHWYPAYLDLDLVAAQETREGSAVGQGGQSSGQDWQSSLGSQVLSPQEGGVQSLEIWKYRPVREVMEGSAALEMRMK